MNKVWLSLKASVTVYLLGAALKSQLKTDKLALLKHHYYNTGARDGLQSDKNKE